MVDLVKEFPNLDKNYLKLIEEYGKDILEYEDFIKNKEYIQHGNVSIYTHCIMVACEALRIARKHKKGVNERLLCRAALLHDYFKYDWHNYAKRNGVHKLHGFYHPDIAADNAIKDFNISSLEENAIRSHMFPLGFALPRSKEAWILFMADKNSALKETITMRN